MHSAENVFQDQSTPIPTRPLVDALPRAKSTGVREREPVPVHLTPWPEDAVRARARVRRRRAVRGHLAAGALLLAASHDRATRRASSSSMTTDASRGMFCAPVALAPAASTQTEGRVILLRSFLELNTPVLNCVLSGSPSPRQTGGGTTLNPRSHSARKLAVLTLRRRRPHSVEVAGRKHRPSGAADTSGGGGDGRARRRRARCPRRREA